MTPTNIPEFVDEGAVPTMVTVPSGATVRVPRAARHMAQRKTALERFDELIARVREIRFNIEGTFA